MLDEDALYHVGAGSWPPREKVVGFTSSENLAEHEARCEEER